MAEVADAAGISRATAYRYFSKPGEMVREALLDAVADAIQTTLPAGGDADGRGTSRLSWTASCVG